MGNMGSFGIRHVLMDQSGGDGGKGGGGGGTGGNGGGAAAFADAGAARSFLSESVGGNADLVKLIGDEHAVPFATALKGRFDDVGKNFPANWREQFAGDNKDAMATLQRFARPHDVYTSYTALRTKMADGSLRPVEPFPEKGTPEQQTAWRVTNGVPATADDYVKSLKLGEGFKVESDEDKGVIKSFADYAHKIHMPQSAVDAAVNWMFESRRAGGEIQARNDTAQQSEREDILRNKYGNDFRANIGRIEPFLDTAPKGLKDTILRARGEDGRLIMNNPDYVDWMVSLARQTNPAGVVIPGAGGNLTQSIEQEIKSIEAKIGTPEYIKDEKMQARLRELYDGYSKATGKQWGQG